MSSRRGVGVFHPGVQHSWQTARALQDTGDLAWYATSIFWVKDRAPYKLVPYLPPALRGRVEAELRRFYHPKLDPARVRTFDGLEWVMRLTNRLGWQAVTAWLIRRSTEAFVAPMGRLMQREPVRAVWGYDLSCVEVFEKARQLGVKRILDRTIGHPAAFNAIMDEVYDAYPEFFTSKNYHIPDAIIELADREHEQADVILVGSPFAGSTLDFGGRKFDKSKLRVVPYCFDDVFFNGGRVRQRRPGEPVRFLFTGQAGMRKGIHLLLKVFDRIPKSAATLTIIGQLQVPKDLFAAYADRLEYYPAVPRPDVARFMREADFLVFPSYFEGGGIVLYEAMAMGMGIVQSKNADVVFADSPLLMNELSEDELYRCVMTAIEDRDILERESARGLTKATDYTYEAYRKRVAAVAAEP